MSRTNIAPRSSYEYLPTRIVTSAFGSTSVSQSLSVSTEYYESRSSNVTPGYAKLVKLGAAPPNSFSYRKTKLGRPYRVSKEVYAADYVVSRVGPSSSDYICRQDFAKMFTTATDLNQRNEAIVKLRSKIKDMSVNVAQAYAEKQMTMNLVGDTIKKIAMAASDLKKGNLVGALKKLPGSVQRGAAASASNRIRTEGAANAFARNWIELQYGWKPLVNDVYGACEALANHSVRKQYIVAKGTSHRTYHHDEVGSDSTSVRNYRGKVRRDWKFTATLKIKDGGAHEIKSLGLTNPLTIAWELTPWSFVVDWALPIGPWIEGFDAMLGLDPISCCETIFIEGENSLFHDLSSRSNTTPVVSGSEISKYEEIYVTRTILDGIPVAYIPYVKNPLSGLHVANAMALLTQVFHGKR